MISEFFFTVRHGRQGRRGRRGRRRRRRRRHGRVTVLLIINTSINISISITQSVGLGILGEEDVWCLFRYIVHVYLARVITTSAACQLLALERLSHVAINVQLERLQIDQATGAVYQIGRVGRQVTKLAVAIDQIHGAVSEAAIAEQTLGPESRQPTLILERKQAS